jgi:hypothetical protein
MPFALLLAMQAAGMVVDWIGTQNQQQMADMGAKIQQAGIEANIQQTRLETEDASLQALKTLRQNLGSQIATYAARGTATFAGSALTSLTESQGNFNSDERTRRINLIGKENTLKAGGVISRLNQAGESSKLWQGFASRSLNRFPSSVAGWKQGIKDFNQGFGLTSLGS